MKKLTALTGAIILKKSEQKMINGGGAPRCDYPEIACYNRFTREWSCVLSRYCN